MMLPFSSSRSSTFFMSNWAYLASRTPSARFSKSQNSAILLISGCPAIVFLPCGLWLQQCAHRRVVECIRILNAFLVKSQQDLSGQTDQLCESDGQSGSGTRCGKKPPRAWTQQCRHLLQMRTRVLTCFGTETNL